MSDAGDLVRFGLLKHIAVIHLLIIERVPYVDILVIISHITTDRNGTLTMSWDSR